MAYDNADDTYDWGNINTGDSNSNFSNVGSFQNENGDGGLSSIFSGNGQDYQPSEWSQSPNYNQPNANFSNIGSFGQDTSGIASGQGVTSQGGPTQEWGGGATDFLKNIFSGSNGGNLIKALAAISEGSQNKKKQAMINQMVQQQQQRTDPFGSQRPFYQQQLQSTVQNPYDQPMVRSQVDQLARAQAIKDAAAGRRSNGATSSPGLLAAQAAIAQHYMNSLMQPAGAGISPNGAGLQELMSGINSGVNGYQSPIFSALGMGTTQNNNAETINTINKLLGR